MAQKGNILLQGFHAGIGNHDTYIGENQVAYAENVNTRDPDKITLSQKPENYALTDNDLVLSKLELEYNNHAYLGTEGGKFYDKGTNTVLGTTTLAQAITNIFSIGGTYVYFSVGQNVGRIEIDELIDGSSWSSGDLEAQTSYIENHKSSSSDAIIKYIQTGSSALVALVPFGLRSVDGSLAYTNLPTLDGVGVGVWKTLNYWKALTHKGILSYTDGVNNILNATLDLDSYYIEGIYANNIEMLISGLSQENTNIFVPNGEGKELLAVSRLSGPDSKKVHYYGRNDVPTSGFSDIRYRQLGNDTYGTYNDICYMINNGGVMSYGRTVPGLIKSWLLQTRNYNGDIIEDVGMVKVETESSTGENWLYFSRRSGGVCGVDRINLDKVANPNKYTDSGYVYTQKFNFGHAKASINKIKMRAYTTSGATIKVYSSEDDGSRTLKQTLNNTDPKKYFLLDAHEQGYTVQRKIELETDNEDITPEMYAFSFDYTIGDNE